MSLKVELSTKNFFEAGKIEGKDEFSFIIDNQTIQCHRFVAAFLSNNVSKKLISDPTADSFIIGTRLPTFDNNIQTQEQNEEEICKQMSIFLQKLIIGESIEISKEDIDEFKKYLNEEQPTRSKIHALLLLNKSLNNYELRQQIYTQLFATLKSSNNPDNSEQNGKFEIENEMKKINELNNFVNLFMRDEQGTPEDEQMFNFIRDDVKQEYNKFIENIAEHFYELDENIIISMNDTVLGDILKSNKLQIESEDSLLHVLLERRSNHKEMTSNDDDEPGKRFFIEQVQFEYVSEELMQEFINKIRIDEVGGALWERITRRLILPVSIQTKNKRSRKQEPKPNTFEYNSSKPFEGIFHHLTAISNGNIHTNKTIEITCSERCCGDVINIVDYEKSGGHLHVNGTPSPRWLLIDFKTRKIQVNSYIIKSIDAGNNHKFMRSWKVEISDDKQHWEKIDERNDISELKGDGKTQVFNVETKHQPFRFIRIITDKDNWYSSDGFELGRLEFFGQIYNEQV